MKKEVRIIEVGLRDGLQNEKKNLSVPTKLQLAKRLEQAGLRWIELGAYVSPHWVPQMKDTDKIVRSHLRKNASTAQYSVLVPNQKGMERAVASGITEIAVFTAASESFTQKNINCSIRQSFERFRPVVRMAHDHNIKVRAYISTAFGCPYEGKVRASKVKTIAGKLFDIGAYEVSVGDTIGIAHPLQCEKMAQLLLKDFSAKKIAFHLHDTRGMALANIVKSLEAGIRIFDTSIGGLGGCPYAKGASGNVATEDVVNMLHAMGFTTRIDLEKLIQTSKWLQKHFDRPLNSKVAKLALA
tara:strand:- start:2170 stop:3066 length:897 start_codon:yes stop_codon:yes gene_type:complete